MSGQPPSDPFSLFRQMVNQWETMANELGGKALTTPEFAQGMQQATAATLQLQQAVQEGMTKVLAAANMPSRDDLATIGERVARIEAQLLRIEAAMAPADSASSSSAAPKPKRSKKPPPKAS